MHNCPTQHPLGSHYRDVSSHTYAWSSVTTGNQTDDSTYRGAEATPTSQDAAGD